VSRLATARVVVEAPDHRGITAQLPLMQVVPEQHGSDAQDWPKSAHA
jgi:hypothetical protein